MLILVKIALLTLITLIFCDATSHDTTEDDNKFVYFAYGSNLLAKKLHIGNPSAEFYTTAKLKGYRLDFNIRSDKWKGAVATICKVHGSDVWGALWKIHMKDMANLDKQEGVDINWYYPANVTVTGNGTEVEARTYIETTPCPPKVAELPPERQPSITYHKSGYIDNFVVVQENIISAVRFPLLNIPPLLPAAVAIGQGGCIANNHHAFIETIFTYSQDTQFCPFMSIQLYILHGEKQRLEVIVVGGEECGLPTEYKEYLSTIKTNGLHASDEIRSKLGKDF